MGPLGTWLRHPAAGGWTACVAGEGAQRKGRADVVQDAETLVSVELGVSGSHSLQLVGSLCGRGHQQGCVGMVHDAETPVHVDLGVATACSWWVVVLGGCASTNTWCMMHRPLFM